MFRKKFYLYLYFILVFILIQGVLASPQNFSMRIRGEVYLRKVVQKTGIVPLTEMLLIKNVNPEIREKLRSISVEVDLNKITIFPVDTVRKILISNGINVDVVVGERVIFIRKGLYPYRKTIGKLVDFVYKHEKVSDSIELGSASGELLYQLENLKEGKLVNVNFAVLDGKKKRGLLYVNYRDRNGDFSVVKFTVNSKYGINGKIGKTRGNGRGKLHGKNTGSEVFVRSGMPVRIVFVNKGIVIKADGYCVNSGKYFYGDLVKVRPVNTGKYFEGKVIGKGEVLVEIGE